jgi:spore-specific protein
MCAGLLVQLPEEPIEPRPALPLEQEFTVSVTLYSARAWLSDNDTFSQTIWKSTRFVSASHARKSIFPVGTVKIVNFSEDTITVTISSESDDALKIVVPPRSEAALTSSSLSDVQASTSGGASKVTFLFHIFFSRDPGPAK